MVATIKEHLTRDLPLTITSNIANQLIKMVIRFEIRDEHPLTLNSQMFGVNRFIFLPQDRQMLFDIIGCEESDVAHIIGKIPSINKDFKVVSDAFNILSVYVAHLILNSKLPVNLKHDSVVSVLNYMQYRIMGSAINHYFPHNANYEIMQTVIESLSMKFSVRQSGTWKNVVTERSDSIAFDARAHHDTLFKFNVDKDILYLISDTSTRIRSQLKIITGEYYDVRATNNFIMSHSSTASIDGEKVLREKNNSFETICSSVYNKLLIKSSFIDERYIKMVQSTVPRLNIGIIRRMLSTIADEAKHQVEMGEIHPVKHKNNVELYMSIESLIEHIIHVIYMSAIHNSKVNINSKIAVYTNTKNVFTASRSSNQELINVRASIEDLMKRTRISSRESTISGLGIALSLYITLISFGAL